MSHSKAWKLGGKKALYDIYVICILHNVHNNRKYMYIVYGNTIYMKHFYDLSIILFDDVKKLKIFFFQVYLVFIQTLLLINPFDILKNSISNQKKYSF